MKKIALTLIAAIWSCVAFAQSTPSAAIASTEKAVQTLIIDKMSEQPDEDELHMISVSALPEIVLEQLKYSELAGHTIINVRKVKQPFAKQDALPHYELLLQDDASQAVAEPRLLVRFDEFGEVISRKEIPFMAQEEK